VEERGVTGAGGEEWGVRVGGLARMGGRGVGKGRGEGRAKKAGGVVRGWVEGGGEMGIGGGNAGWRMERGGWG